MPRSESNKQIKLKIRLLQNKKALSEKMAECERIEKTDGNGRM